MIVMVRVGVQAMHKPRCRAGEGALTCHSSLHTYLTALRIITIETGTVNW